MIILKKPLFHERMFPIIRAALGKRGGIERENAARQFFARDFFKHTCRVSSCQERSLGNVFPETLAKPEGNHSIDKERGATQSNSAIFFFTFYEIFL